MPRIGRMDIAAADIVKAIDAAPHRVFNISQLSMLLLENRDNWRLAQRTTVQDFIDFLERKGLQSITVEFQHPGIRPIRRFIWKMLESSPYELAQSLKERAYLSHGSAVHLHALTDQLPKTIYINQEQSPKPSPSGPLLQANLDRAFASKQRQTQAIATVGDWQFVIINGKHTDQFGVQDMEAEGTTLRVTGIDRTLIDIAVRPAYAGGVFQVLNAYRGAMDKASVGNILAALKTLDYMYPYHQAIGFYMQRAGWPASRYDRMKKLGLDHDFYLAYDMREKAYSEEWRLFYPEGFEDFRSAV